MENMSEFVTPELREELERYSQIFDDAAYWKKKATNSNYKEYWTDHLLTRKGLNKALQLSVADLLEKDEDNSDVVPYSEVDREERGMHTGSSGSASASGSGSLETMGRGVDPARRPIQTKIKLGGLELIENEVLALLVLGRPIVRIREARRLHRYFSSPHAGLLLGRDKVSIEKNEERCNWLRVRLLVHRDTLPEEGVDADASEKRLSEEATQKDREAALLHFWREVVDITANKYPDDEEEMCALPVKKGKFVNSDGHSGSAQAAGRQKAQAHAENKTPFGGGSSSSNGNGGNVVDSNAIESVKPFGGGGGSSSVQNVPFAATSETDNRNGNENENGGSASVSAAHENVKGEKGISHWLLRDLLKVGVELFCRGKLGRNQGQGQGQGNRSPNHSPGKDITGKAHPHPSSLISGADEGFIVFKKTKKGKVVY